MGWRWREFFEAIDVTVSTDHRKFREDRNQIVANLRKRCEKEKVSWRIKNVYNAGVEKVEDVAGVNNDIEQSDKKVKAVTATAQERMEAWVESEDIDPDAKRLASARVVKYEGLAEIAENIDKITKKMVRNIEKVVRGEKNE